ncbi:hypothetical protein [Aminobacter sp. MET-1]|uniref:hypothetical protein n=1 Tax=Aminobacter sp. MET-1 TaxID=2951085 RepID=UPI002269831C|nr:hypothetical protein [Aminobacter sp. MET-1]MCX8571179.1 hypothetical protein [Aminobacter sp. MET-1]MCX8573323.1 hypothetical protein [Aminobacter sp. MET-1]
MSFKALLAAASLLIAVSDSAGEPLPDLTIDLNGDLLNHGGVVVVYTIPVPPDAWTKTVGDSPATNIRLDGRYAEVQLRYPKGGRFAYRFRPVEGTPDAHAHATQVLSVIGTDMEDRGPQMTAGFENAYSDGGQIIRVPPLAELTGQDEPTRTMARWGETERNDAPPPADQRSARALVGIVRHGPEPIPLRCNGDQLAQVCTIPGDRWPVLEARWWRAIAEQRLERLRDRALRRCYDSSWSGGGRCEPDPESDEPAYLYRK